MKKPELSIDGILSYQHTYKTIDELYSAFAYLLKQMNSSNEEATEGHQSELANEQLAALYYQMVNLFSKETRPAKQPTAEDLAFFLEHDITWFSVSEQEAIEDGVADFLETFFNAEWSKPNIDFLFLVGHNGYALRFETSGAFMGWFMDAEFSDGDDLPFVETQRANAVHPPELPEEPTKGIRRRRTKKEEPQKSFFELGAIEKEIHERLSAEYNLGQEDKKEEEPELSIELNSPAFVTDEKAIHEMVKSAIGEVVMAGSLVHPLTPAEWQEVYEVLYGAVFLCIFGSNNEQDDVPTLTDVAETLHDEDGTGQVVASLYLLTQNIHALQHGKRVEKLQEVTALLRYYDWLKFETNTKEHSKVNDTLLRITTTVLSEKHS